MGRLWVCSLCDNDILVVANGDNHDHIGKHDIFISDLRNVDDLIKSKHRIDKHYPVVYFLSECHFNG